ncbi:MAG: hypothetical protein ACREVO_08900 [Steroidobacteraceae bacterium]
MSGNADAVEASLREIEQALKRVSKQSGKQITKAADRDYLKSVAYAWFETHRRPLDGIVQDEVLKSVDTPLRAVLDATARSSAKSTYLAALKEAKGAVTSLRGAILVSTRTSAAAGLEAPPDFAALASDATMRSILERRWNESQRCVQAGAPLAATVMMGGLLEALFVARANLMSDKSPLFRAKAAPKDSKTGKTIPLQGWKLSQYIDVAAELNWISHSGKTVADVLREYRNYIHPEKERAHGVNLNGHDSSMFWDVTKNLTRQLLASASQSAKSP